MPRPDVKVRLAQNEEAPIVAKLFAEIFHMGDWQPEFKAIFPHWLVAEIAGEIVGTINIRISLPISSIEMLSLDSKLTHRERAVTVSMLIDSAVAICAGSGAVMVSTMIPDELVSYRKILEKKGLTEGSHGNIMFGRYQ